MLATALMESPCSRGAEVSLTCQPIVRVKEVGGGETLIASVTGAAHEPKDVAFLAVVASSWPPGLVPLFAIEKDGHFELRRRPLRGQENLTEPLFFAAPLVDERESAKVAGRWDCVATYADGSKKYPGFEVTTEGDALIGRFDQNTDFRFAFLTGGAFRTNRIELHIEYSQDRYIMTGRWHDGKLRGTWEQLDGPNQGTWEAERPGPRIKFTPPSPPTPLYEWHRAADGARRYSVATSLDESGWERAARPLCLVWSK